TPAPPRPRAARVPCPPSPAGGGVHGTGEITQRGVVVFALSDSEYQRWLELEATQRRSRAEEDELAGYLGAIIAAEGQGRRWVVDYLRAQHEWLRHHDGGTERAQIYRAVAPLLPAEWGARRVARVHGECRHADDAF